MYRAAVLLPFLSSAMKLQLSASPSVEASISIADIPDPNDAAKARDTYLCRQTFVCAIAAHPCLDPLEVKRPIFFPDASDASAGGDHSCPLSAPFMFMNDEKACCFETKRASVWPGLCAKSANGVSTLTDTDWAAFCGGTFAPSSTRGYGLVIDRSAELQFSLLAPGKQSTIVDKSSLRPRPDQSSTVMDRKRIKSGKVLIGLPPGYSRPQSIKPPRMSFLMWFAFVAITGWIMSHVSEKASELEQIAGARLREAKQGSLTDEEEDSDSEIDEIERGLVPNTN